MNELERLRSAHGMCEGCGKVPAPLLPDPFLLDVHEETVMRRLCEDCRQERADDI